MAWRDHTRPGTTAHVEPISSAKEIIEIDIPGESVATTRMEGDTCVIRYTPDLYQQHRHRNGEQITVDGVPVKLIIEKTMP